MKRIEKKKAPQAPVTKFKIKDAIKLAEARWEAAGQAYLENDGGYPVKLQICRVGPQCICGGSAVKFEGQRLGGPPTKECPPQRFPSERAKKFKARLQDKFPQVADLIRF